MTTLHPLIRQVGDPILRTRAKPITKFDARLAAQVERMFLIMAEADGAGLAANQIGQGNSVYMIGAASDLGPTQSVAPNVSISLVRFPADKAKDTVTYISPVLIGINAATKYPQQARAFINFLGRPKQAALFAKVTGGVSDYDAKKCVLPAALKEFVPMCKAGKLIGQWAKAKFATDGKSAKIAMLDLNANGVSVDVQRDQGFLEGFGIPVGDNNKIGDENDPRIAGHDSTSEFVGVSRRCWNGTGGALN